MYAHAIPQSAAVIGGGPMKRHSDRNWFPNMSIRKKLMLTSIAILVPTLMFLLLVYGYWSAFVRQETIKNFNITNDQLIQTMEDNIERRQIIVRTLCESSQVQKMIRSKDPNRAEEIYMNDVKPIMNALTETSQNGQMIWIIRYDNLGYEDIHNDYEGIISGVKKNSLEIENGLKDYAVFNVSRVSRQNWFRKLKGNLEEYKVQRTNMDYLNHSFSVVAEIKEHGKSVGMIRLISPLVNFIGEEAHVLSTEAGNVFVLDEEFYLISTRKWKREFMVEHASLFEQAVTQMKSGKRFQQMDSQWIISADVLGNTGFYLVVLNSARSVSQRNQQLRNILLFCIIMIFLLVSLFVLGISRYLNNRLLHLLRAMERFQEGKTNAAVTVRGRDEIGMLYAGYNQMTQRISDLMLRNIEIAREKETTKLQLLQMQINPHFLYNSLSTIQRLAELDKTDLIKDMVFALTKFYRLSLNKGKQVYTVRDEIQQIEAYIRIFTIRKGNIFSCSIEVDPACGDYHMPKLILQPFVENIFQHAFDEEHLFVNIRIMQREDADMLLFVVADDGCGMSDALLEHVRTGTYQGSEKGFGINNVISRLRLIYGVRYSLSMESGRGMGTKISIKIPKSHGIEEK